MSEFGVPVALHDRCPNCGSNTTFAGIRQLICDGCEVGRGHISRELRAFLEKFVHEFGLPGGPIILRTGKVHKPAPPESAARLKRKPKLKGKSKMKMQELFPSKYLRAADLDGKPRTVVVDHVGHEEFRDDGVLVKKTVLYFKKNGTSLAPLICNKTNWKMIVALTGCDDDEGWAGARLELRVEKVNSPGGRIVDSIRVYGASQPHQAKAKPVPELNDELPV